MSDDCNEVGHTLQQESARNEDGVVYKPCEYTQETDSLCSVIFDPSSNVTYEYVTVLPEAEEEIVYLENTNEDIKVEVDICSENYQVDVSEAGCQIEVVQAEPKSNQKVSKKGLHTCKICSKTFSQVMNLVTHERTHTGEKPYVCSVCNKRFSQHANMSKHMRTHTGERPFQCAYCTRRFTQQANLKKHIRIHTGERPYACHYCSKRFTQQTNLSKHVRLHTGERPFHCRFCTKTFVQQSNLERHERTHTGEKPFKCQVCGSTFAQNAHLAKHVRSIHGAPGKPIYFQIESESEEKLYFSNSEQTVYVANPAKNFGIPVLYNTKTGKIIKRMDY